MPTDADPYDQLQECLEALPEPERMRDRRAMLPSARGDFLLCGAWKVALASLNPEAGVTGLSLRLIRDGTDKLVIECELEGTGASPTPSFRFMRQRDGWTAIKDVSAAHMWAHDPVPYWTALLALDPEAATAEDLQSVWGETDNAPDIAAHMSLLRAIDALSGFS